MKKRAIALMLTAVMALSLAACGGGATTTREDTGASSGAAAGGSSNKVKVDPYAGDEVKIAYIAHDIGTPNNQGWKEGIERECHPGPTSKSIPTAQKSLLRSRFRS